MTGVGGIGRSHRIDAKLAGDDSRITIRARQSGLTSNVGWLTVHKRVHVSVQSLHYPRPAFDPAQRGAITVRRGRIVRPSFSLRGGVAAVSRRVQRCR